MSNENKEWTPGMDMGFEVGQTVYFHGTEGTVDEIDKKMDYPVSAIFGGNYHSFLKDGRFHKDDISPSLFHKPQTFDISRPEWQPKPGEWCWFWNIADYGFLSKFSKMCKDKYVDVSSDRWENCAPFKGELPEHLKDK